jgi:hypothetical protein
LIRSTAKATTDGSVCIRSISDVSPHHVNLGTMVHKPTRNESRHFRIPIELKGRQRSDTLVAMVDSGASSSFISRLYVNANRMQQQPLEHDIPVYNIDSTLNSAGSITHSVTLKVIIGSHVERHTFLVTDIGSEKVILGLPWLRAHNPMMDFDKGALLFSRCKCEGTIPVIDDSGPQNTDEVPPLEDPFELLKDNRRMRRAWVKASVTDLHNDQVWIAAGFTYSQAIAEKAGKEKRERTFEEIVPPQYRSFSKVFNEQESERLPDTQPWDHTIDLKPGAPETMRSKNYPMSPNEQEELHRFLEENLRKGYIVPSKSPIASPVFFIKKKDGKLRLVIDYQKLNDIMIKNRYPLPLAMDIVNQMQGARYFTKFNVRWGYHNVRIKEGDEWKAAFTTNCGLFEPRVMLFGLTNSPATFQALMNTIFADLIAAGRVVVYLDDILIYSTDLDQHRRDVQEVLQRLQNHDLYLQPEKCEFEKTEIKYLGLVIKEGVVSMDPAKVQAVREWPTPRNLHNIRAFVGFANFYRRFIRDFSQLCRPLHDLTKKDTPFVWGAAQKEAFRKLCTAFTEEPALALWEQGSDTQLEVDTSAFATGGVLLQLGDDGLWHPVAYRSESMIKAERNYQIWDCEMLAIIRALEDWCHYLEGTEKPFEIITDHSNLTFWTTTQNLSRRQARWALWLSRFNFTLIHKPGKTNIPADALSRRSDHATEDSADSQDVIVLGPEKFRIAATKAFEAGHNFEELIRKSSAPEAAVISAMEELKKLRPRVLTDGNLEWQEIEGLVYYREKLYIPDEPGLCQKIVASCHNAKTAGHPGRDTTIELVSRHYWWSA